MRKRKGRQPELTETLIHPNGEDGEYSGHRSEDSEEDDKSGFFACYLLTSLCPRYKGHTYIGFTVNPRRRIRQHNGELCSGAWRTKKKRPWEMVLCIYGFPTNVAALQFEWAWQHPVESLAVRNAAVGFKSLGGLANKIKLAYTMLTLPTWNNLNLSVNFFSTKYTKHYAGCPTLPTQMRVYIRSMDELPCYTEGYKEDEEDIFRFENDFPDHVEEPERSPEDIMIPVCYSANHHSNEEEEDEEAVCVSDTGNYEQPSSSNKDQWDDDKGPEEVLAPVFADHQNNEKEAICVSDDENNEPICHNIPKWSFMNSDYFKVVSPTTGNENSEMDCVGDKDQPKNKICCSGGEVEVVDLLFTPSPKYINSSRRKKRRGSVEIIDLTESPICV
ncbi:hypothetical protein R6Q59_026792 [Mikania micrantha]